MRNIYKHPVTKAEVLLALHEAMQKASDETVGNISPYVLKKTYDYISRHTSDDDFKEFWPG